MKFAVKPGGYEACLYMYVNDFLTTATDLVRTC